MKAPLPTRTRSSTNFVSSFQPINFSYSQTLLIRLRSRTFSVWEWFAQSSLTSGLTSLFRLSLLSHFCLKSTASSRIFRYAERSQLFKKRSLMQNVKSRRKCIPRKQRSISDKSPKKVLLRKGKTKWYRTLNSQKTRSQPAHLISLNLEELRLLETKKMVMKGSLAKLMKLIYQWVEETWTTIGRWISTIWQSQFHILKTAGITIFQRRREETLR